MVATKVQLVPASRKLISAGKNRKTGVTVHETGNQSHGAGAQAHANLQANGNSRSASWHWQVDDKIAIQSYRHNDRVWHGGHPRANQNRISVEICVNSDSDYKKAVQNAAELVAMILKNEGRTPNDVDQHATYPQNEGKSNQYTKNCPERLRGGNHGVTWNDFLRMVREAFDGKTPSLPSGGGSTPSPTPSNKTVAQLAQEVIDGKWGTGDERKAKLGSRYAEVQAEVNRILGASSPSSKKSEEQVAQDIANGRGGWGNDPERSRKLKAAGYDAAAVQRRVNQILSGGSSSSRPKTSMDQVAREVIDGKWGNDPDRTRRLRSSGHDPAAVQQRVNQILTGRSSGNVNVRASVDSVARQIINGQGNWGNDPERSKRLRAAGYDPAEVQRRVNQLLS